MTLAAAAVAACTHGYDTGALHVEGAPAIDRAIERAGDAFAVPSARVLDISDDGRRVLAVVGGRCTILPAGDDCGVAPIWGRFGDDGAIATLVDTGDERAVLTVTRGETIVATTRGLVSGGVTDPVWDRARGRFVFGVAAGAGTSLWLWSSGSAPRMLVDTPGMTWAPLEVTHDAVLARAERSSSRAVLASIDLATGRVVALTAEDALSSLGRYLPNGTLARVTDAGRDRRVLIVGDPSRLAKGDRVPSSARGDSMPSSAGDDRAPSAAGGDRIPSSAGGERVPSSAGGDRRPSSIGGDHIPPLAGGDHVPLAVAGDRVPYAAGDRVIPTSGDVTELAVTSWGTLAFVTEDAGVSTLFVMAGDGASTTVTARGEITDLRAARDAPVLAYSFTDATHPRGVFTLDLTTGVATRWTRDERPPQAVEPTRELVIAADGVHVPLYEYAPPGARSPVVIEFHGGPEDRWTRRYSEFTQLLVARGYAVIRPNVRGSAGQGRAFAALDDGDRRGDVLRDVAAILDWIRTRPELDPSRVVVMGQSYGGWLALTALLHYPSRLRGAITLGAITDLPAFLDGTASYRRAHRLAEYGDNRALLHALSPIAHVDQLRAPILVAHGALDPRVPPATADRFVRAARAAGVRVWALTAADEGHWFTHSDNLAAFETLALQFLAGM